MRARVKSKQEMELTAGTKVRSTFTDVPAEFQNEFNKLALSLGMTKRELYMICGMIVMKKLGKKTPEFPEKGILSKKWITANKIG
jgi:hypothetical protein